MNARLVLALAAALFALAGSPAPAGTGWLSFGEAVSPEAPQVLVREDTAQLVRLEIRVPGAEISSMATPEGPESRLTIPGQGHTLEIGAPALPVVRCLIEVPLGAVCSAQASAMAERELSLEACGLETRLWPVQPPRPKDAPEDAAGFSRDARAYARRGWSPETLVRLSEVGEMRGHRLLLVEVHPLAYDPVAGRLVLRDEIEVLIRMEGADLPATLALQERTRSPFFERILAASVANQATFLAGRRDLPALPAGLLIITADAFAADIEPLAEWKTLKGYPTTVVTTSETGSTSAAIQDFIENAYLHWDIPPTWVLLVGDTNLIPTFTGSACGTETDLYYVAITAGDYLPELDIGRFPARTALDVQSMVTKVLHFEQMDLAQGVDFMNRAGWIASSDMGAMAEDTHNYCISQWFDPAGMENTRIYERLGGSTADIRNAVNRGLVVLTYSGHGSDYSWGCVPFGQTDVRNLTNLDMYPFVSSHACETGSFGVTECYGETWVIAPNKGAIGFWGASNSSYWDEDDILERETWEAFWERECYDLGGLCHQGLLQLYLYYGGGGSSRYYFEMYNLLGDPSADLWATLPDDLAATHPGELVIGQSALTVTVTSASRSPVADALVCAYLPDETHATAYTDALGQATLLFDPAPTTPGTLFVTVTKHDHEPCFGSLQIVPAEGPYLVLEGFAIDDDGYGASSGNGDGGADAGERIEIALALENVGIEDATSVTALLSVADPMVSVIDGSASFGTIPAGSIGTALDDCVLQIAGTCPDGHSIACGLTLQAATGGPWQANFVVSVAAPQLALARLQVDDAAGGDGNGRADPGETVDLRVFIGNAGHEDALDLSAGLAVASDLLTIVQGEAATVSIAPGQEVELTPPFRLSISPASPEPETYDLWVQIEGDWSYAATLPAELAVGGFWDDIEAGEGGWTHAIGSTGFVDQWHRSQERDHSPEGTWSWKQGDTGAGTYANLCHGCLVTEAVPLAATTRLRFWHWMQAETSSAYAGYAYDGGLVEVSLDGGPWTAISPAGGYPYRIRAGGTPGPFPAETPVYSGTFDWSLAEFTLEELTAGSARFRFCFGSDGADALEGWHIDDVEVSGSGAGASAMPEAWQPLALRPELRPNAPNPFRPQTTVAFELPSAQPASLRVYDANGRLVRTLAGGMHEAGLHRIHWDGADDAGRGLSSGVYYCRLETEAGVLTRPMTLVR